MKIKPEIIMAIFFRYLIAAAQMVGMWYYLDRKTFLFFFGWMLFDVIVNGSCVARWGKGGWDLPEQRKNDIYMTVYFLLVISSLAVDAVLSKNTGVSFLVVRLYMFLLEDVHYYIMMPILNPLIKLINGILFGEWVKYRIPAGVVKERIGSYGGWIGRKFKRFFYLTRGQAMFAGSLFISLLVLYGEGIISSILFHLLTFIDLAIVVFLFWVNGQFVGVTTFCEEGK